MAAIRRLLVLIAAALLVLPTAAPAADPYEINVITSLTGPAGFLGQAQQSALRALEAKVNKSGGIEGRPIKFVIHDDATVPQNAVQLVNQLIAEKVPYFIGPALVQQCLAVAPLIKDNGPVGYCLSNGVRPPAGSYQFSSMMLSGNFITAAIRYARLKGARRVGVIVGTDATGQDAERSFDETMALPENREMTVSDREHFNLSDITVAAQLARIKASNADLILAWSTGTPVATVLRGIKELGMDNIPVIISSGNATIPQMKQYAPILPKEVLFGVPAGLVPDQVTSRANKAAIQDCVQAMAAIGVKPDLLSLTGWDPGLLVVDAVKKLKIANVTPERMRTYISGLNGFAGAAGIYDFRSIPQRGLDERQTYVARWDIDKAAFVGISKAGGAPL
jgi:branched-chain amino acid transport system substrate-binding protein